jgi:hypothetical protein
MASQAVEAPLITAQHDAQSAATPGVAEIVLKAAAPVGGAAAILKGAAAPFGALAAPAGRLAAPFGALAAPAGRLAASGRSSGLGSWFLDIAIVDVSLTLSSGSAYR